jgi:hypothetical protein
LTETSDIISGQKPVQQVSAQPGAAEVASTETPSRAAASGPAGKTQVSKDVAVFVEAAAMLAPQGNTTELQSLNSFEVSPKADVMDSVEFQVSENLGVVVERPLNSAQPEQSAEAIVSEPTVTSLAQAEGDHPSSFSLAPGVPRQKRTSHLRSLLLLGAAVCALVIVLTGVLLLRHALRARSASPSVPIATRPTSQSAPPALNNDAVVSDKPSGARLSEEVASVPKREVPQTITPARDPGGMLKVETGGKSSTEVTTVNKPKNSASGARSTAIESVAGRATRTAPGKCELLPSDLSSYLDRADKDRAAGHYDDAARQYGKVIECDPHNARAQQGSARTRQARAVSAGDSEDAK